MSVWNDIFNHLKEECFDVYPPATKKGECKKPYIVVKHGGLFDTNEVSSVYEVYNLYLYIPVGHYSTLHDYKENVKQSMKKMFPKVRSMHDELEPYYDEDIKAYMLQMKYLNYRKKERT